MDSNGSCLLCNEAFKFTTGGNNGTGKCFEKPCFQICPNCTSASECKLCESCSQCTSAGCSTCSHPIFIAEGCLRCANNNYLTWEGYCTPCNSTTDPNKFVEGSNNGTGECTLCSSLYKNCQKCNKTECLHCSTNYMFDENGNCTQFIDQFVSNSTEGEKNVIAALIFYHIVRNA